MDFFRNEIQLEDSRVLIRKLKQTDFDGLKKITYEEGMWEYNPMSVHDDKSLKIYLDKMFEENRQITRIPFVVIDKATGETAGSSCYMNIALQDRRLEIGSTWYGKEYRGTGLNKHCKFLLISFAFDNMKMERVEFKTDVLNQRSRRALTKIGAFEEGVLRSHIILHTGRRRDSIYFSILKNEWDFVKQNYFSDLK